MSEKQAVTQDELDSLLSSLAVAKRDEKGRGGGRTGDRQVHEARVHDFARSEALPRTTVQALEGVYSSFARGAQAALSAYLRTPFQAAMLSLDQLTYDQFVRSVPDPTVIAVFSAAPLPGRAILELNPAIGFWIVDRMLGGDGDIAKTPRPLTDIEKALMERPVSRLLDELRTAWEDFHRIEPGLVEMVDSAGAAEIAKATDAVAVASFEVTIGSLAGMASICFPGISLKLGGVGAALSEDPAAQASFRDAASMRQSVAAALSPVAVSCAVRLGTVCVSAAELADLEKGDVLCLNEPIDGALEMSVEGVPKFQCRPLRSGEKQAVEIVADT